MKGMITSLNLKLLSLFVKDYETLTSRTRDKCAAAAGFIGIISNVFLAVLKIVIGILTSSIAITADAINNLTDAGSSVITIIGFKLSEKPADAEHPYGHKRIEYITGLIVSMVITILGVQFLINSFESIFEPSVTEYSLTAFIILAVSIIVKLWQSRFYTTVGRYIDSTTLEATASDSRNDAITTLALLVGAVIAKFAGIDLDGWFGCAVAIFIIKSGIGLIIETADPLLGLAPDPKLTRSIGDKILSYDGVLGYHDLMIHNYGPDRCFVSVHVEVPAEQDILISHDIIDNIEFDFLRDTGMHVVIHLDPVVTNDSEMNDIHSEVADIIGRLSCELKTELSMHDFRVVKGQTHTNLIFDVAAPFDVKLTDNELCERITHEIHKLSPSYNSVITCDHCYSGAVDSNQKTDDHKKSSSRKSKG